jgi:hypothetical protein
MVDSSIGKLAANDVVSVGIQLTGSTQGGFVEFNGEKPQGMQLCLFIESGTELGEGGRRNIRVP